MTRTLSRLSHTDKASIGVMLTAALWAMASIPNIDHPMGSDWAQYFTVAEILWHDDPHLYPPFRKPMFGLIIGGMGEALGYFQSAQIIGKASAGLIVLAAGLGARALVGPLAGAAAAICATLMPLVMDGALWVNNYPLLSACSCIALSAGAALSRWPQLKWALTAGLSGGLAMALDVRGIVVLPCLVLLLLIGAPWRDLKRALMLGAALIAPILALHAYDAWLAQTHTIPQFSLEAQTQRQRQAVLEPIARGQYVQSPQLKQACKNQPDGPAGPLPWLKTLDISTPGSCAQALRAYSLGPLQKDKILPGKLTLWLLPLVLIPMAWRKEATGRDRARSAAASAVVFGIPTLSVFIGMGWVFYFDRYLMPFSALLAMAVPVAFGRLCALKKPHMLRWVAALGATAWSVLIWPGVDAVGLHSPHTQASADMSAGAAAKWAKATMSTNDRMFDCGGLALDYLLLPQQIDYVRHPPGDRACESLIRNPGTTDGQTFLITAHRPGQQDLAADALAIQSLGWQAMDPPDQLGPYQLWVHGKAQ